MNFIFLLSTKSDARFARKSPRVAWYKNHIANGAYNVKYQEVQYHRPE